MKTIRLAESGDAGALAALYGTYVSTTSITCEIEPPTEADFKQRIANTLSFAPWLVYENAGEKLGYAYASKHHVRAAYQWSVDLAVYIREDRHRRGIGRALYTSLIELLKLQGFYAAHAGITLPNPKSVGIHESFGFKPVGVYKSVGYKFGAWHDVGWWQLPLRERVGEPAPTRSVEEIRQDPRFSAALASGLPFLAP